MRRCSEAVGCETPSFSVISSPQTPSLTRSPSIWGRKFATGSLSQSRICRRLPLESALRPASRDIVILVYCQVTIYIARPETGGALVTSKLWRGRKSVAWTAPAPESAACRRDRYESYDCLICDYPCRCPGCRGILGARRCRTQ